MQKKNRHPKKSVAPVAEKIPLVSVIIPMFNSERYIADGLDSLLAQTFQNFEVVVVDDCSTDNSVEVVESFSERFGRRLHVLKLPKNSGTPNAPRNVGIQFARGKYIAFLDSDDLYYTKTALEELAALAEEHQADVVHTDTFFMANDKPGNFSPADLIICQRQKLPPLSAPTFETPDLAQRIRQWVNRGYNWEPFTMFCKRDFLIAKQIYFPEMLNDGDRLFSFRLLCLTEKFLRVPNVIYIFRQRADSVSHKKFPTPEQHFNKWFHVLRDGINEFERIMASVDFFDKRPDYHYAVLNFFAQEMFWQLSPHNLRLPLFAFDDMLKKEFSSDDAPLAAYMFNTLNIYRLQIMELQQELNALKQSR
ncbi:MAG: glycosyltransferase family 2 protein [Quinella sp. 2Q5]|nr:glycosyltransferase family 2 protein [Quinella sp. 2Q5]